MLNLRDQFSSILQEAKLVAQAMVRQMPSETEFSESRKKKKVFMKNLLVKNMATIVA